MKGMHQILHGADLARRGLSRRGLSRGSSGSVGGAQAQRGPQQGSQAWQGPQWGSHHGYLSRGSQCSAAVSAWGSRSYHIKKITPHSVHVLYHSSYYTPNHMCSVSHGQCLILLVDLPFPCQRFLSVICVISVFFTVIFLNRQLVFLIFCPASSIGLSIMQGCEAYLVIWEFCSAHYFK